MPNALVDAKYRSYYKRRRPEDEDMMGVPWPNYTGMASGGYSGGGGGGGIGNAGGFAGSTNALLSSFGAAPNNNDFTPEPGDGGNQGEGGPAYGKEGTLDDAITGMLGTLPIGPMSLLGFIGLSEKEQAQNDINYGLNTDRARMGRSLGMAPTKDPYSYGPDEAAGFSNDTTGTGEGSGVAGADVGPASMGPDTSTPESANSDTSFDVGNAGYGQGGEAAGGGGFSSYGGGNDGGGGGNDGGGLGVGSDPGQAGNTGGASSESPGLYHTGGVIPSDMDMMREEVPITALEGEGVLRPEAMELLGPDFVHTVNALAGLISRRRAGNALIG
jgi:hypothetical protein